MPLGTKDVLLMIRARDAASRQIREVAGSMRLLGHTGSAASGQLLSAGLAMTAMGSGMAVAGGAALNWFDDATNAAITYRNQVAQTRTQVDDLAVTSKELAQIGMDVAEAVPRPLEEMQQALFDIFSSMEATVPQAKQLLQAFAEGAVAGQVEVRTAARGTIAILNAFSIPAEEINRVMDVQFQLVRKGIGTYEEFAGAIGRALPAWGAADQSIEDLAGAMAFLTRQGLSPEMAATSAARAMETVAAPKAVKNLRDLGVAVTDASGAFLPMREIVRQLVNEKGWKDLTGPQLREAFISVFGTGHIQARRFFDLVFQNFEEFDTLTQDMFDSAGVMKEAYRTMFEDPQNQIQLLRNQYELLRIEIGEELIPAKLALARRVRDLIQWFRDLDPTVRRFIITAAVVAAAVLFLAGIVFILVGAFLALFALFQIAGGVGGLLAFLAKFGLWGLVIAAVVAAIWWLIENWDKVWPVVKRVWERVKQVLQDFLDWFREDFLPKAEEVWNGFLDVIRDVWDWMKNEAWPAIQDIWQRIMDFGVEVWHALVAAWHFAQEAWDAVLNFMRDVWQNVGEPIWYGLLDIWHTIQEEAGHVWQGVQAVWDTFLQTARMTWDNIGKPIWEQMLAFWEDLRDAAPGTWSTIAGWVSWAFSQIQMLWNTFWPTFQQSWNTVWEQVRGTASFLWDQIVQFIRARLQIISGVFNVFAGIFSGDWSVFWQGVKSIAAGVWTEIQRLWDATLFGLRVAWAAFHGAFRLAWQIAWAGIQGVWDGFLKFLRDTWDLAWRGIKAAFDIVKDEIKGKFDTMAATADVVWGAIQKIKDVIQWLIDHIPGIPDVNFSVKIPGAGLLRDVVGLLGRAGNFAIPGLGGQHGLATSVSRPTLLMVGENNTPEDVLVVPKSKGGIFNTPRSYGRLPESGGMGNSVTINGNIVINGGGSAEENRAAFMEWLEEVANEAEVR